MANKQTGSSKEKALSLEFLGKANFRGLDGRLAKKKELAATKMIFFWLCTIRYHNQDLQNSG